MFPLLDNVTKFWKPPSLKNIVLIGAQHLLGCTAEMIRALCKLGLSPENIFLIGKCYSTSLEAVEDLHKLGVYICPSSSAFNSHKDFDNQYTENVGNFLKYVFSRISPKKDQKIIVLDDGGTLIKTINQFSEKDKFEILGAVEQTSSGYNFLTKHSSTISFPILNVARSKAKLIHESPFIAKNCLNEISHILGKEKLIESKTLILGDGPIGQAVCKEISSHFCEMINPQLQDEYSYQEKLTQANIIIGCTGYTALPAKYFYDLQHNTYLISCSSSDREFDAVYLRQQIPNYSNCLSNPQIKGIHLIRSGFPVNFSGKKFVSKPKDIELTISLLFSSILNLLCKDHIPNGFASLDIKSEKFIISKYKQKKCKPLIHPPFVNDNHSWYSELTG